MLLEQLDIIDIFIPVVDLGGIIEVVPWWIIVAQVSQSKKMSNLKIEKDELWVDRIVPFPLEYNDEDRYWHIKEDIATQYGYNKKTQTTMSSTEFIPKIPTKKTKTKLTAVDVENSSHRLKCPNKNKKMSFSNSKICFT